MTDLDRLLALLDGAGYTCRTDMEHWDSTRWASTELSGKTYGLTEGEAKKLRYPAGEPVVYHWLVTLPEGIGYFDFRCEFYFAADGSLLAHGVWE
jgi:hypothetical protein